ncbi:hypothetical protein J7M02_05510 [Candidatus Aerophobetes bacterium]|nr:hypothetical protein [Candidatus Aerophobetes bacterium]
METTKNLESPRIYGLAAASIEVTLACITTILKRVVCFVIGITLNLIRHLRTWDKFYKRKLRDSNTPASILFLINKKRSPSYYLPHII